MRITARHYSRAVRSLFALLLVVTTAESGAESIDGQTVLNDQEIIDFLAGSKIKGDQKGLIWEQVFDASGQTTYTEINGYKPTLGYWKASDNKYCSQWPPSSTWSCYVFTVNGEDLTFIPPKGDSWPATRIGKP